MTPAHVAPPRRLGRTPRLGLLLLLALLATGCLEVEQHPTWRGGEYDGKRDALQHQLRFGGDRLGWMAVIDNRTREQNEYRRVLTP